MTDHTINPEEKATPSMSAEDKLSENPFKGKQSMTWNRAADLVLSALSFDKERKYWKTTEVRQLTPRDFPEGQWRELFIVLRDYMNNAKTVQALAEGGTISDVQLMDLWTGGKFEIGHDRHKWFTNIWDDGVNNYAERTFVDNLEILVKHARAFETQVMINEVMVKHNQHRNSDLTLDHLKKIIVSVEKRGATKTFDRSAINLVADIQPDEKLKTGTLTSPSSMFMQISSGGFPAGIYEITGAQKSGKTRFALAHCVWWLLQGKMVYYQSLEMHRKRLLIYVLAMLASQRIAQTVGPTAKDSKGLLLSDISPVHWMTGQGYDHLQNPKRKEAITWAKQVVMSFGNKFIIDDNQTDGAHIRSPYDSQIWLNDAVDTFGQPHVFVIDHIAHYAGQHKISANGRLIFEPISGDYERMQVAAPAVYDMTSQLIREGTTSLILSQRNKASNSQLTPATNSSGTKGGDSLGEKVDGSIIVNGNRKVSGAFKAQYEEAVDDSLFFWVRNARYWKSQYDQYDIPSHEASGWLYSPKDKQIFGK